ncbi:hypothetical protein CsSME_00024441 [Camellia sinensis var. sinensis]
MAFDGMLRFDDFEQDMPEDFLLRERTLHLSYDTSEYVAYSWTGYRVVMARDCYRRAGLYLAPWWRGGGTPPTPSTSSP